MRGESSFSYPVSTHGTEILLWLQHAENTGVLITIALAPEVVVLYQKRQAERVTGCCSTFTKCWASRAGVSYRVACCCPHPQIQSPGLEILPGQIAPNLFPKELTSFAPLEKFNPKGTLKNRGGCDERQLGDSRNRLKYRPSSLQGRNPPGH